MCNIITNSFSNISRKNKEVEYYHSTNNPKLSSSPNIQTLSLEHILLKKNDNKKPPQKAAKWWQKELLFCKWSYSTHVNSSIIGWIAEHFGEYQRIRFQKIKRCESAISLEFQKEHKNVSWVKLDNWSVMAHERGWKWLFLESQESWWLFCPDPQKRTRWLFTASISDEVKRWNDTMRDVSFLPQDFFFFLMRGDVITRLHMTLSVCHRDLWVKATLNCEVARGGVGCVRECFRIHRCVYS